MTLSTTTFAGYKNATHEQRGYQHSCAHTRPTSFCVTKMKPKRRWGITNYLSSAMGALMVETPQSVPTAPSMHKHTMRVVLVMECEFRFLWIPTRECPCRCNTKRCLPIPSIAIYDTIILDNYANKSFTYIGSFAKISNHLLIIPAIIS